MKKILFLLLIFVIKLSAYEYLFFDNYNDDTINYNSKYRWFTDSEGNLEVKIENFDGSIYYGPIRYNYLNLIRRNDNHYIKNIEFKNLYNNDLIFLNDLYNQATNQFLNYLYNENYFNDSNYVNYENYELLYNEDGLAVESIVNGVWAGLYDDNQKSESGALYNSTGSLVYYNGRAADPVTSFLVWLQLFSRRVVLDAFMEIKRSVVTGIIMTVVIVLAVFRFVLLFLPSSISKSNYGGRSFRSGGGGGGSLPDFGDGRAVAASVRERLANKNRSLKRQSERSGVTQSMENSILFDLEER